MGLTIAAYCVLAVSGLSLASLDRASLLHPIDPISTDPISTDPTPTEHAQASLAATRSSLRFQLRSLHIFSGVVIVGLVLLLLAIGIVGTLGHFGTLGHSLHLPVGLTVVGLTIAAAVTGLRISGDRLHSRIQHRRVDFVLLLALVWVVFTGWDVVQKYLPKP